MEDFERYLAHFDRRDLWTNREWSEPLDSVYLALRVGLREGWETLVARPGGFIWYRDGREVDHFPSLRDPTALRLNFRELLRIVRRRDPRVREHLRLVGEAAEGPVYRLTRPDAPTQDPTWAEADRRDAEEAPIALLLGPAPPRAREPRSAWGLRTRLPIPYDLATLRTSDSGAGLLIQEGIAVDISWVARADPTLTVGVEAAQAESVTTGWPPDELLERAQVKLEDAQSFLDGGGATRAVPLRVHHREAAGTDTNIVFIYLTGPALGPQDFLLVFQHIYDALIGQRDQLLAASALDDYGTTHIAILVVRAGTVMAVLNAGTTGALFLRSDFTLPVFSPRARE